MNIIFIISLFDIIKNVIFYKYLFTDFFIT